MVPDEDKGFEVIDKRKRRKSAESEPSSEPVSESKENGEAESATGDVYSLMQWVIVMLAEAAWQWMGLHMNPVTKKVQKDMAQAKAAIDSVVFLCDQVAPHVSEEQRAANRNMITDLRMNFVQQQEKE